MLTYAEQRMWREDLMLAGWETHEGWWVHPHVNGLHNLLSAIAIFRRWVA